MRNTESAAIAFGFAAIVIGGGSMLSFQVVNALHVEEKTCIVNEKHVAHSGDSSSYRLDTENCGVVTVEDSLIHTTWNAADRYSEVREGGEYDMKLVGYRVPFLSMFPNAVEIKDA